MVTTHFCIHVTFYISITFLIYWQSESALNPKSFTFDHFPIYFLSHSCTAHYGWQWENVRNTNDWRLFTIMLHVTIFSPSIMSQYSRADHRVCNEMHASIAYLGGIGTAQKVPISRVSPWWLHFSTTPAGHLALQYLTIEIANNCDKHTFGSRALAVISFGQIWWWWWWQWWLIGEIRLAAGASAMLCRVLTYDHMVICWM